MSEFYQPLANLLLDTSLRCLLLAAIVWLTVTFVNRLAPTLLTVHARHRVWTFVLLAMLAIPALGLITPRWSIPVPWLHRDNQVDAPIVLRSNEPASRQVVNETLANDDLPAKPLETIPSEVHDASHFESATTPLVDEINSTVVTHLPSLQTRLVTPTVTPHASSRAIPTGMLWICIT